MSHPAWVCGLKLTNKAAQGRKGVTPCVGVWIETGRFSHFLVQHDVTPCVGVWIETSCY